MMNIPFKRTTSLVVLLFFLLVTCKDNDDPVEAGDCVLTSTEASGQRFTYKYDGEILQSRTQSSSSNGAIIDVVTLEYDGSGSLAAVNSSLSGRTTFTYSDGVIVKSELTAPTYTSRTDYEYSGGQLVKIQYYKKNSSTAKGGYITAVYTGSSFVRKEEFVNETSTDPGAIVEYTFGEEKSFMTTLPAPVLKWAKLEAFPLGENILNKSTLVSAVDEITYTHEFNSSGLPTASTGTYKNASGVIAQTYLYKCE